MTKRMLARTIPGCETRLARRPPEAGFSLIGIVILLLIVFSIVL